LQIICATNQFIIDFCLRKAPAPGQPFFRARAIVLLVIERRLDESSMASGLLGAWSCGYNHIQQRQSENGWQKTDGPLVDGPLARQARAL